MTLETNSKSATEKLREKIESLPEHEDFLKQMARYVSEDSLEHSYLLQIGRYPRLSFQEIEKILSLLNATGNEEKRARKKLSESHLALVVWIAKDFHREDIPFMDLINEGNSALVSAINTFNPQIDSDFPEFLVLTTQKAIREFVKAESTMKDLPNALIEKINSIKPIVRKLAEELGTEPTRAQIAKELNTEEEDLERLINLAKAKEDIEGAQGSEEHEEELEHNPERELYEDEIEQEYEESFEDED